MIKSISEAQKRAIYKYKESHKDKVTVVLANWKAKNADYIKNYSKEYYQKNKEKILQCRKENYALKTGK